MTTTSELKEIIPHHESISQYLPYGVFDSSKGMFFSDKYDTCFFIFETAPLAYPDKNLIETTTNLITQKTWPKNTVFQTTMYADPNLDRLLEGYMDLRGDRNFCRTQYAKFLHDFSSSTCDFYKQHVHEGIHPHTHPVPFRNFRSFISIQVPCSTSDFNNGKNNAEVLFKAKNLLASNFRAVSVPFVELTPDSLLPLLYEIWNMGKKAPANLYWDKNRYLRDQIVRSDTIVERQGAELSKINEYFIKVKTPQQYPQYPEPFTIQKLVGEINNSNSKQVKCPYLLTTYAFLDPYNDSIKKKGGLVMTQQSATAMLGPRHQKKQEEYMNAVDIMDNKGGTFLNGGILFAAFSPSEELLKDAVDAIDTIWEGAGFTAQNEPFTSLPIFMSCIPGGILSSFKDLRREIPATAKSWALMSAIQADSKGTKTPTMFFSSRRGQLITLDLRDSDSNFNAVVFAPSGSGKSFFTNNIIVSTLSTGGRAYLIDIGRSYQKLAESLDGQIIEFKKESDINLNLFSLVTRKLLQDDKADTDRERLESSDYDGVTSSKSDRLGFDSESLRALLHRLLCQMAFPKTEMQDHEKSLLGNILDKAIGSLKDGERLSIDLILKALQEKILDGLHKSDDTAGKLYECLLKYGSDGIYARWFTGMPNLNFEKSLVVLELEELRSDPDLREVILLLIMGIIDHQLYIENDRSRHTLVVLDEAWDLLNGANSAPFIETGYRRARKYLGSYILITQSRKDLEKYPALGQAIVNNSAFQFFLAQKSSDIDEMKEQNLIALSDYDTKLLKQVHTVKGVYSEIGVIYPSGAFSVIRLIVSDKTKMLFTTDPNDMYCINRLKAIGYSLNEALEYASKIVLIMAERNVSFEDAYIATLDHNIAKTIVALMGSGHTLEEGIQEVSTILDKAS